LNSRWILYYAGLGFDVLTYKTVRTRHRASFEPPNLLPVTANALEHEGSEIDAGSGDGGVHSWAISFGMPSKDPAVWQEDVARARKGMQQGQVLVVSVVASPERDWSMEQVAADFAQCARWAADAGAHAVEANFSCPNVCSKEADLYLDAEASRLIAFSMRAAVPELPLILKIGLFQRRYQAEALVRAVSPFVNALSTTNSISAKVRGQFSGLRRGIGGACITGRCMEELQMLREIVEDTASPLELIGVGGVMKAGDVQDRLAAGAHHVQLATAAMLDPEIAIRIRTDLTL